MKFSILISGGVLFLGDATFRADAAYFTTKDRDINFLEPKKQQSLFGETFDEEFADECEGLCGV